MSKMEFTPLEQEIIERAHDLEVTRRRTRLVIFSATMAAIGVLALGLLTENWVWVTALAVLYVIITAGEKVAYGNAVLAYKSVITKLLQGQADSSQAAHGR